MASFLEDAAHTPGGHTTAVALPTTEGEVASALRHSRRVLPVGAQSSLTGGATPMGESVLSLSRMNAMSGVSGNRVRVEPGVAIETLETALAERGLYYPPASTFRGASVGGSVATNAAGASTFKHGTTRRWVHALTVVLADGDVLDIERGAVRASDEGAFEIEGVDGRVRRIVVPAYTMPDVPKCSAAYYATPGMDLIDLFIGAEGTLGIVSSIELLVVTARPTLLGWMALPSESQALAFVAQLRELSRRTWAENDAHGIDVAAIESLDGRSLALLREDGVDGREATPLPADAEAALLFQVELAPGTSEVQVIEALESADTEGGADSPIKRLVRLASERDVLDRLELVLPGDTRRAAQLSAVREAVPEAVNHRIAAAQREHGPEVRKTAGDMIVPFAALGEMMTRYRETLANRELDHAIWGHVSDGNLHVNVIPRSAEETRSGEDALLKLGAAAIALGGSPLAEHGVGRNPVKQRLLRQLYGEAGVNAMRRVKAALDPEWKLAPGVLFTR
jgi:D-lactate dehydrogenase (cytochrome)